MKTDWLRFCEERCVVDTWVRFIEAPYYSPFKHRTHAQIYPVSRCAPNWKGKKAFNIGRDKKARLRSVETVSCLLCSQIPASGSPRVNSAVSTKMPFQ